MIGLVKTKKQKKRLQLSIEQIYVAFYFKNKVSAHGLVLLVQLSWRVAPPWLQIRRKRQLGYQIKENGELAVNLKKVSRNSRDYSSDLSL